MTSRKKQTDLIDLKNQVLNPRIGDKEGRTELDVRADINRRFQDDSIEKLNEQSLVIELLNDITEFDGPSIVRLINYVTHSKFSREKIAEACVIQLKKAKLNSYQKIELIKYVLSINPNKVETDLIRQGLSEIKSIKPWLYAEILSLKSPHMALEYVIYLLQSNQYSSSSFVKLFLKWFGASNPTIYKTIASKIFPLVRDPDAIKLMKFKFEEKSISNLLSESKTPVIQQPPQSFVLTGSKAFQELKSDLIKELKRNYEPEYAT